MLEEERLEELQDTIKSSGFKHVLVELDKIVAIIQQQVLSVPLDKDPEKAALSLYAERMKLEGAVAMRNAFVLKMKAIKEST